LDAVSGFKILSSFGKFADIEKTAIKKKTAAV